LNDYFEKTNKKPKVIARSKTTKQSSYNKHTALPYVSGQAIPRSQ